MQSKNEQVEKFLTAVMSLNYDQYKILQELRLTVFQFHPNAQEKIMYGGIMFSLVQDFGGLFVRKNHVSFEFINGYLMIDSKKILEGGGQYRRHLKIKSINDIKNKNVEFFIKQVNQNKF